MGTHCPNLWRLATFASDPHSGPKLPYAQRWSPLFIDGPISFRSKVVAKPHAEPSKSNHSLLLASRKEGMVGAGHPLPARTCNANPVAVLRITMPMSSQSILRLKDCWLAAWANLESDDVCLRVRTLRQYHPCGWAPMRHHVDKFVGHVRYSTSCSCQPPPNLTTSQPVETTPARL